MPRNFTNLTDAQRQQFLEERMQACNGKAEGDSCALQDARGNAVGACSSLNGTLECVVARGNFNGTGFNQTRLPRNNPS
ncbi:MAG: hypothetical protein ACP5O3_04580 [Candidatus Micrarchaeia archaeon]